MAASGPAPPPVPSRLDSSPYDRVEVLMIRWSTSEDVLEEDDIELQVALEKYGYGVTCLYADELAEPDGDPDADSHVADIAVKCLEMFDRQDGKKKLLVVTYVGHANDEGGILTAGNNRAATEEFDLSHIQAEIHRRVKHSHLLWVLDSCHASFKGWAERYPPSDPSLQRETLAACEHDCPLFTKKGFSRRLGQNLRDHQGALTALERFKMVRDPMNGAPKAAYRLDSGLEENSIVLAPLRGQDGEIQRLMSWHAEELLGIDVHTHMPEEGTWEEWTVREPEVLGDGWRGKADKWGTHLEESSDEKSEDDSVEGGDDEETVDHAAASQQPQHVPNERLTADCEDRGGVERTAKQHNDLRRWTMGLRSIPTPSIIQVCSEGPPERLGQNRGVEILSLQNFHRAQLHTALPGLIRAVPLTPTAARADPLTYWQEHASRCDVFFVIDACDGDHDGVTENVKEHSLIDSSYVETIAAGGGVMYD